MNGRRYGGLRGSKRPIGESVTRVCTTDDIRPGSLPLDDVPPNPTVTSRLDARLRALNEVAHMIEGWAEDRVVMSWMEGYEPDDELPFAPDQREMLTEALRWVARGLRNQVTKMQGGG